MLTPLGVIGVMPFVIEAGDTLLTAATDGSTNWRSTNCVSPRARSVRTTSSAAGFENLTSSSVSTEIAAAFAHLSVMVSKAMDVIGLGAASPTHPAVVPAVARGKLILNGTLLK